VGSAGRVVSRGWADVRSRAGNSAGEDLFCWGKYDCGLLCFAACDASKFLTCEELRVKFGVR